MLVRPSVVHSVVGSGTSGLPAGLRVAAAARRRRSGLPALCCNCAVLVLLQMHAQPVPYDRSGRLQYHNRLRHGAFGRARVRCRAGSAHDARSNNNCYQWQQPLLLVGRVPREVRISRRSQHVQNCLVEICTWICDTSVLASIRRSAECQQVGAAAMLLVLAEWPAGSGCSCWC